MLQTISSSINTNLSFWDVIREGNFSHVLSQHSIPIRTPAGHLTPGTGVQGSQRHARSTGGEANRVWEVGYPPLTVAQLHHLHNPSNTIRPPMHLPVAVQVLHLNSSVSTMTNLGSHGNITALTSSSVLDERAARGRQHLKSKNQLPVTGKLPWSC